MAGTDGLAVWDVDWRDDDAARDFALNAVALKESHNVAVERQAELNIHWIQGRQEVFYLRGADRIVQQQNPNQRIRIVYNLLWAPTEALVAKLSSVGTGLTARPASTDIADYDASIIQGHVLGHYTDKFDWDVLTGRFDRDVVSCGETFVKVIWNPAAGDAYSEFKPDDLKMGLGEFKKLFGVDSVKGLHEGDVEIVPRNIFQIFWGPLGVAFEQADWVVEVCDRSKAYAAERYGLDPGDLESVFGSTARVWSRGMMGVQGVSERQGDSAKVRIAELWVRANGAIPGLERGRHIVVVGSKVPVNGANPYDHGQIPIVRYPLVYVTGEIRSSTWVTSALPMQRDCNQALGQACENRERVAHPRVWVQEGTLVDKNQLIGRSGGVVEHRGSQAPVERPVQDHHRAAVTALEVAKIGVDDLAGIRAVSQGRAGPSVRSAAQVSLLQNQDDERLTEVQKQRRRVHRRVGQFLLAVLHQFATEERTIRILGEETAPRTILFSREMLGPLNKPIRLDRYNVKVVPDMPPRSRGAMRTDLDTLITRGFLKAENPDHEAFVFDTMQMGLARREPARRQRGIELQHERDRLMALGKYEPPRWYEPLMDMEAELRRFQSDAVFRQLSPERQALFLEYGEELIRQRVLGRVYQQTVIEHALAQVGIKPGAEGSAPGAKNVEPAAIGA